MSYQAIRIHTNDNVAVITENNVQAGCPVRYEQDCVITARNTIPFGHKIAIQNIQVGTPIRKYGSVIGIATECIQKGDWIHTQNMVSSLQSYGQYTYQKEESCIIGQNMGFFQGYLRKNGEAGIRNEVWVLPMVSCVNHLAQAAVEEFKRRYPQADNVFSLSQPYGCSQLGKDHETTVSMLKQIALHPNAGGILLCSLGCENNTMESFLEALGDYDHDRIQYIIAQEHEDELEVAVNKLHILYEQAQKDKRTPQPFSKLKIGFKCGASDGFSGITANPLVGKVCEQLALNGACTALTEVPEMFGAEQYLMNRAKDYNCYLKIVSLIQKFKDYYIAHQQPIYENPSPGNKKGGITTLEEKSLGCIQKGGRCEITSVLDYAQPLQVPGLSLIYAPGNDPVSITALAGAGCQIIIFTTGRGNPLGGIVPTIKVSSNYILAQRKSNWIDFDASQTLSSADWSESVSQLLQLVLSCADGDYITKSEQNGFKEIGIFKDGVIL